MSRKHLRNLEKYENQNNMVSHRKNNNPVTKNNIVVTHEVTQSNTKIDIENQYICEFCNKKFKHSNSYYRHCKHYCLKKKELDENKNEIKRLKEENEKLKNQQSITNNTNNIQINTYIKNDKVLNYLNNAYPDAIEIDSFINRLKNDTSLPREMMDCFLTCYNNGGTESFGTTLVKYLNQICKQLNINIFPLCCSDSNLRSHKEKNSVGWETVIDTTKIEDIIQHIVSDIFMETGNMINLDAKERKKICNIVKKSYGINSIGMIESCIEPDNCEVLIPIS
tara:strand:- start:972 stop:1811 length:840 start_codon:yes stop_codon:yes gene_type:complete